MAAGLLTCAPDDERKRSHRGRVGRVQSECGSRSAQIDRQRIARLGMLGVSLRSPLRASEAVLVEPELRFTYGHRQCSTVTESRRVDCRRQLAFERGKVAGTVLAGGVFGFDHLWAGAPLDVVPILALSGIILCVIYETTWSLWPCIALHALINAEVLALLLKFPTEYVYLVAIAGAALTMGAQRARTVWRRRIPVNV